MAILLRNKVDELGLVGVWVPETGPKNPVGTSYAFNSGKRLYTPIGVAGQYTGNISSESALHGNAVSILIDFTTGSSIGPLERALFNLGITGVGFHASHSNASYSGAIWAGSSYNIIGKPSGGTLLANTRYIVGVGISGTIGAIYNNGSLVTTVSGLSARPSSGSLSIGQQANGTEVIADGIYINYLYVSNKKLSDAVFYSIAKNPWQIFKSKQVVYFIPSTGELALILQNLAQDHVLGSLALTQQGTLSTNSVEQTQVLSVPSLVQQNALALQALQAGQTLSNIDLVQVQTLALQNINHTQTLDNVAITSQSILSINGVSIGQTLESISLAVAGSLDVTNVEQSQILGELDITQQNTLAIQSAVSGQTLDNVTLNTQLVLGVNNVLNEQTLQNAVLTQAHVLQVLGLLQEQTITNVNLSQQYTLIVDTLLHSQLQSSLTLQSGIVEYHIEGIPVYILAGESPVIIIQASQPTIILNS